MADTKSVNENYIFQYWHGLRNGSIIASDWVQKAYEQIIEGLEKKEFFYNHKKAKKAIDFIESFCRHHEGVLGGQLISLELWQKAFISVVFGIVDENGFRHFQEVFLVMGRKNGKTLLASAIMTYMAYADGEYGARIYTAAPKLDQAKLCFDQCYQTIKKEPELNNLAKKRRADVYIECTNSTIAPLSFNEKKSDGFNISCVILDELASWEAERGLKFYEVLRSSTGSRKQPLLLGITTAGYVNGGIYDELYSRATRILLDEGKENRFFPLLYTIDDINKWDDMSELQKSNPNLNVSITPHFLSDQLLIAENSYSAKNEFIVKYCCLKQNSAVAWLPADIIYSKIEGKTLEELRHSYAVGGIDLSMTTDLTSACIVVEKEKKLYVISHFWMPKNRLEVATHDDGIPYGAYIEKGVLTLSGENYVDYKDCLEWFKMILQKYEIIPLEIGYDKYNAQYLVQEMRNFGFHMDDVKQGPNLTPVIREMEGLLRDGLLNLGNNDLLKIHLLDCALKTDTENNRCSVVKLRANAHIDGAAALLDALCVRQKYFNLIGEQLRNERGNK